VTGDLYVSMRQIALSLPILLVAACVELTDDAELGETDQALSSFTPQEWSCTTTGGFHTCNYDLGTQSGRACVITGIRGQLINEVRIFAQAGNWHLEVGGGNAQQTNIINTVCMPATSVVTSGTWASGGPAIPIAASANRRCYLSRVANYDSGFASMSDYVQITQLADSSWQLSGAMASGTIHAFAAAMCFTARATSSTSDFVPVAKNLQTTVDLLATNGGSTGTACTLTRLGGIYTATSTSAGTWVRYSGASQDWNLTLTQGHSATAECFR
jgi:hypothetical protein